MMGPGQLLLFSAGGAAGVKHHFVRECRSHGIDVEEIGDDKLLLRAKRSVLDVEASHCGLVKSLKALVHGQAPAFERFDNDARQLYADVDSDTFFSPAEVVWLTSHILHSFQVCPRAVTRTLCT